MHLNIDTVADSFDVLSFTTRERMNGSYHVDVTVAVSAGGTDLAAQALDQRAVFVVDGDTSPRAFHGVVSRVRHEAPDPQGRRPFLIRIEPTARRLSRGSMRQIFQDVTAVDVVTRVLSSRGVAHRIALRSTYALRPYCTQYDESDWEFVTRLLADEGIAWWWEHPIAAPPGSEVLVLDDSASPRLDVDGGARFAYREADGSLGMAPREADVTHFEVWTRARARAALRQGYDLAMPLRPLLDARSILVVPEPPVEPDGSSGMRGGLDPALLAPPEVGAQTLVEPLLDVERCRSADGAPGSATVRLEQARANVRVAHGETLSVRLSPGRRLDLSEHPDPDANRSWTITEVRSEGFSPSALPPGRTHRTHTAFACVPAEVRFRPRAPRRAFRQVTETAVVVGAEGQEIHTDELGRVKVRFHWDPSLRHDDTASCWLRVTQMWAGAGWGTMFIPRVGMEVLVTYLGGDTDRPVVSGCLYNGLHPPPWPLPQDSTKSGIRTQTVGGPGASELVFQDGRELAAVQLRSSGALGLVAKTHQTLQAGGDLNIEVNGNRRTNLGGDDAALVRGNLDIRANGEACFGGASGLKLSGLDCSVEATDAIRITGGVLTATCSGSISLLAGNEAGDLMLAAGRTASVGAATRVTVQSATEVVLRVGATELRLGPDEILMRCRRFRVEATDAGELTGDAWTTSAKRLLKLSSQTVQIVGEEARLSLDRKALLEGDGIQLQKSQKVTVAGPRDKRPLGDAIFCLPSEQVLPNGQTRLRILAPDGTILELPVPPNGEVRVSGHEGDCFVVLGVEHGKCPASSGVGR